MYLIKLFKQYYIHVNENTFDEIHNPDFATVFSSIKEATDWVRTNTTLEEYAEAVDSVTECQKYAKWMENGGIRRSFDFTNNELSRKYNNESPEEIFKWRISIDSDNIRYEDYRTWPDLYSKFNNLWSVACYSDGEYKSVRLYFTKVADYDIFKRELDLVLPYVTRFEGEYKVFDVFDRFLSEGGNSVCLYYKSDSDCYVYGRWNQKTTGDLKRCFEYLREHRYYE